MTRTHGRPVTIQELQKAGVPLKPAREYIPKAWRHRRPVSLKRVHTILSKVKGSLADEIVRMRQNGLW